MSKVLAKAELLRAAAQAAGITAAQAEAVLLATAGEIRFHTDRGLTVAVPGLGRFVLKVRAARTGRNPQTGVPVDVPEKAVLSFRSSPTNV